MTRCSILRIILTRLQASIGVTCSYSSHPFLCPITTVSLRLNPKRATANKHFMNYIHFYILLEIITGVRGIDQSIRHFGTLLHFVRHYGIRHSGIRHSGIRHSGMHPNQQSKKVNKHQNDEQSMNNSQFNLMNANKLYS